MRKSPKFSPEIHKRAFRKVQEHQEEYPLQATGSRLLLPAPCQWYQLKLTGLHESRCRSCRWMLCYRPCLVARPFISRAILIAFFSDRSTDSRTSQSYLEGLIGLDDQSHIDHLSIPAGPPATVLLNTRPRTLLIYFTRPLTERMASGLKN